MLKTSVSLECISKFTSVWQNRFMAETSAQFLRLTAHFRLFWAVLITLGSQTLTNCCRKPSKPVRTRAAGLEEGHVALLAFLKERLPRGYPLKTVPSPHIGVSAPMSAGAPMLS